MRRPRWVVVADAALSHWGECCRRMHPHPQYSRPSAGAAAGFEPVPAASSRVDSLDLLDEFAIRRYLDEAKEQLDVIDFRRSR